MDFSALWGTVPGMPDPLGNPLARQMVTGFDSGQIVSQILATAPKAQDRIAQAPSLPTLQTPAAPQSAPQNAPTNNAVTADDNSWQAYFTRAVIIILGFIFVGIGLSMFAPKLVPIPGLPK